MQRSFHLTKKDEDALKAWLKEERVSNELKIYKSNLEKVLDEEDHLYYYLTVRRAFMIINGKQKEAMKQANVDYVYQSIFEITYNCLLKLL